MGVTTSHLQSFLNNAAALTRTDQKSADPNEQVKIENLQIKNIYIGKDGQAHVSNSGLTRFLTRMFTSRSTGETALMEAMAKKDLAPEVISKAMQKITDFNGQYKAWVSKNETNTLIGMQTNEKAPTADFGDIVNEAAKEVSAELGSDQPLSSFDMDFEAEADVKAAPADNRHLEDAISRGIREAIDFKQAHHPGQPSETATRLAGENPLLSNGTTGSTGRQENNVDQKQLDAERNQFSEMLNKTRRAPQPAEEKAVDDIANDMLAHIDSWGKKNDGGAKMEAEKMDARRQSPNWKDEDHSRHIEKNKHNPLGNMPETQKREIEERWRK